MAYISDSTLHGDLDDNEEQEFRKWARDHFDVLDSIKAFGILLLNKNVKL